MASWQSGTPGVVALPSGRRVRGRGVGYSMPPGAQPAVSVYLLDHAPDGAAIGHWPARWVAWPDFAVPTDPGDLRQSLVEVLARAGQERVELACWGGRGRTGTALACLAILDGTPPGQAVAWVRRVYDPATVETPEQERFVATFS